MSGATPSEPTILDLIDSTTNATYQQIRQILENQATILQNQAAAAQAFGKLQADIATLKSQVGQIYSDIFQAAATMGLDMTNVTIRIQPTPTKPGP